MSAAGRPRLWLRKRAGAKARVAGVVRAGAVRAGALLLATALMPAAARSQEPSPRSGPAAAVRPAWADRSGASEPAPAQRRSRSVFRFTMDASAGAAWDSNLERRGGGLAAFGMQTSALAGVRATTSRLVAGLEYGAGLHRWEVGGHWNRTSQAGRANVAARLGIATISATGEVLRGIASEDQEIGNQYAILPRLELRFDASNRLRLNGGYRIREFGDLSGSDARNRLVGLDYRVGRPERATLEVGSRFEVNETPDARSRFDRWTHWLRFSAQAGSATLVSIELRKYSRRYPDRLLSMERPEDVALPDTSWGSAYEPYFPGPVKPGFVPGLDPGDRFPRHDMIWIPSLTLVQRITGGLEIELDYQYETRLSNDLRRDYDSHAMALRTRFRR